MISFPKTIAAATFALIGVSNSAECQAWSTFQCISQDGALARLDHLWDARWNYCYEDRWKWESCYTFRPTSGVFRGAVTIQNSKPGVGNQQLCWNALENIINQCRVQQGEAYGEYSWGGTTYRIGGCTVGGDFC